MGPQVLIEDAFLEEQESLYLTLLQTAAWDRSMAARQTASYGVPYNYTHVTYPATPMHPALDPVANKLEQRLGIGFNNCLLNYYGSGENTLGFHSDDTSELQADTGVAIVSLGHVREITYRHKLHKTIQHVFTLHPGSLLYMNANVQVDWLHAIKRQPDVGPRISLTWRAFRTAIE